MLISFAKYFKNISYKQKWLFMLVFVVFISVFLVYYFSWQSSDQSLFITASVKEGKITQAVIATGTLNPVSTVQVGSYVSGRIEHLFCDFNTKVEAGQICAKIDPRPYQVVYDQALANLANAQAQLAKDKAALDYIKKAYNRDVELQKKGIVSRDVLENEKSQFDQALAQIAVDKANIKQREAAVNAAKVNLDYTDIVSPVDGIVVSRSIDVGQTVAASFQTPTLFLIAKDLTQMQVDTNVNESDIGGIKEGQTASFTVEAYPQKSFEAQVIQVRQAPISVQNIVTYNVVIGVSNPDFKLLPGMTAKVRILVAERDKVLMVPVQALRFSLTENKKGKQAENKLIDQVGNQAKYEKDKNPNKQQVYLLRKGKPEQISVDTGLNDGAYTEIMSPDIQAGDTVITNQTKPADSTKSGKSQRSPIRF